MQALLLSLVALLLLGAAGGAPSAERVYMLVDPEVSAASAGWRTVVPPAAKEPRSPLMQEKEVWEVRWDNTYPTTRWDAGMRKFRMWYGCTLSCDRAPRPSDARPNAVDGCGHPTWHQQYPNQVPLQTQPAVSAAVGGEVTEVPIRS
jgi:hypothetical protein